MARLNSIGFELNSTTANVELTTVTNGSISTTTVGSGTYAGRITSLSSGAARGFLYQFLGTAAAGPYFVRFRFRYATLPTANNVIFTFDDDTTVGGEPDGGMGIKLTSSGTLNLFVQTISIGTSSALDADTWYTVEVEYDATQAGTNDIFRGRINGVEFAGTNSISIGETTISGISLGGNLASEAQTTGDWFFDDIAINDSTGSFQNSWPGAGEIIHLRPNAAGDNTGWSAGTGTSFAEVDEVTPDDATTYIGMDAVDAISDFNIDATPAALASSDTINCVQVGVRFGHQSAEPDNRFVLRIKASASGTVEESSEINPSVTAYNTNSVAAPKNYNLTLYDLPGASTTAYTKADLDTTQIGVRQTAVDTNDDIRVSTLWLLVDHTPGATLEQEGFAFGDDDGNEASHTLDTQDTNVTEPLGVKTLRALINATLDPASIAYKLKFQKDGSGGYADVAVGATTTTTPTPTTDEGTESGNNTASTSWAVSYPNASTGDLIIIGISWDDSTSTTDVAEPAGPNSEVLSEVNATPAVSSNTAVRAKVWYTIATGTWTASTLTFTPTASEQWQAGVVVIPAGEFDATTPIGASTTDESAGATETDVLSEAFSAGASDGGGRLFCWTAADLDPQTLAADWTQIANNDIGAVSGAMFTRDAVVTDSESIAEDVVSTIAGGDWCSVSFVVRPNEVTNEVYISASANVTAGGEATTARLTAPAGKTTSDFDTGRRWDNENGSDSIDITADDYTELEWVLTTQSPAANDDYFEFRVYNVDAALDTYTVTPKWTIGAGGATAIKDIVGMGIIPFAR